LFSS
jgi:BRCA1-associated protein